MRAKIKAGSTIWDSGKWPDIEYGDADIIFEVREFGNPDYVLCSAANFGLEPYGNGPLYVQKKFLEVIDGAGVPDWMKSIFGGTL